MARRCSVCDHEDLAEINSALAANEPLRTIADRWSVSKTDLMRHRNQHLPVSAVMSEQAEEITRPNDLLDQICDLQEHTQAILERATETGELNVALQAISEAKDNMELLAKLLDESDECS